MKKLITLLLVLTGCVCTAMATNNVTLYFYPDNNTNWTSASAAFRLELYDGNTFKDRVDFAYNSVHGCYYYTYDSDTYNKFKINRVNPEDKEIIWDTTPSSAGVLPTQDSYLYLTDLNWGNASYNVSLVPWKYYFYGSWGAENAWCAGDALVESDGKYQGDLVGKNGKNFVIFEGSQINYYSNTVWDNNSWNNAWRAYQGHTVGFVTSEKDAFKGGGTDNTYINTEGTVSVTFTKTNDTQGSFQFAPSKTITIGTAGYATWSNSEKYGIAYDNVTDVYVVSAKNTGSVTLNSVKGSTFAGGTGVIIKGSGTVTINAVANDAATSNLGTNYLVGSGNSTFEITDGNKAGKYIFNWDGSDTGTVGFYKASTGTLGAHKAYLDLSGSGSREFFGFSFDDETTGIAGVEKATEETTEKVVYNLNGQRVMNPSKGLYIVNGKKVIIK